MGYINMYNVIYYIVLLSLNCFWNFWGVWGFDNLKIAVEKAMYHPDLPWMAKQYRATRTGLHNSDVYTKTPFPVTKLFITKYFFSQAYPLYPPNKKQCRNYCLLLM